MACSRRRLLAGLTCLPLAGCAGRTRALGPAGPEYLKLPEELVRTPAPWKLGLDPLDDVEPALRVAFTDARGYEPMPPPKRGSWRIVKPEPTQSVWEFRESGPNKRAAPRDRIVVLPLGEFPLDMVHDGTKFVGMVSTPELAAIETMLAAFYSTPVDMLPRERFPVGRIPKRIDDYGYTQFNGRGLLDRAVHRVPDNAHSLLLLVNVDLYVFDQQRYAFGWSTYHDRIGVVGFSRLDPGARGGFAPAEVPGVVLRRGLKVAVHEVGHMFGLGHCQAFCCLMNGMSDHVDLDATPLRLCPLCLRKLHIVTGLDPRARDAALLRAFAGLGLVEEEQWLAARVRLLWPDARDVDLVAWSNGQV